MANVIDYVYRIVDQYTPTLKKMGLSQKLFKNDIGRATRDLDKFKSGFRRFSTMAVIGGIVGVTLALKKSSQAYDIQRAAIANVEATLQSTGGSVGRTLAQLETQAASLQKNTFFGDEAILQNVTAQLLTFTNITEKSFDKTQQVVLDVSAKLNGLNATGESTKAVSIMLGKALNDPVANLGALSRAGIQFSEDQKELIKSMWKSGQQSKAQTLILAELEKQYGGTANALAMTTGGMKLQIKNQIGDIQELIGEAINPLRLEYYKIFKVLLPKLIPIIKKFSVYVLENKDAIIKGIVNPLKIAWAVISNVTKILYGMYKIIKPFAPIIIGIAVSWKIYRIAMMAGVAVAPLIKYIGVIWRMAKAQKSVNIIQAVFNALMRKNPIGMVITAVGIAIGLVYLLYKNWDKVKLAIKVVGNVVEKIKEKFKNMIGKGNFETLVKIFNFLSPIYGIIKEIWKRWEYVKLSFQGGGILQGLLAIGKALLSVVFVPFENLLNLVKDVPIVGKLANAGLEMIAKTRLAMFGDEEELRKKAIEAEKKKAEAIAEIDKVANDDFIQKQKEKIDAVDNVTKDVKDSAGIVDMIVTATAGDLANKIKTASYEMQYIRSKTPEKIAPITKTENNVNANMNLQVYTEKGINVRPYNKPDNVGVNMKGVYD